MIERFDTAIAGLGQNVLPSVLGTLAFVAAVVTACINWRTHRRDSPPKRRLTVTWRARTASAVEGVGITHQGRTLSGDTNLHVATISITNSGKFCIATEYFDQGRPMELNLGVPILLISEWDAPRNAPVLDRKVGGFSIFIGPSLIKRKQVYTFHVHTAGKPALECVADVIPDAEIVIVEEVPSLQRDRRLPRIRRLGRALPVVVIPVVVSLLVSLWVSLVMSAR